MSEEEPGRAVTNAQLRAMLEKAREDLEIPDDFKIETENLKEKAASISFNSRVISINEELLYDPEIANYLIYHELAHYKLRTKYHPPRFYDLLYSKLGEENVKNIEKRVLRKMWEINHRGSLKRRAPRRQHRYPFILPRSFFVCRKKRKRRGKDLRGNPFTRTSFPSLLRTFLRKSRLSAKNGKKNR